MRRVWPTSHRFKATVNGGQRQIWAIAYPVPQGGFLVIVDLADGRLSYYIESIGQLPEAVKQAIIDYYTLAKRPIQAISIEALESLDAYETYLAEARDGTVGQLKPLDDIHAKA